MPEETFLDFGNHPQFSEFLSGGEHGFWIFLFFHIEKGLKITLEKTRMIYVLKTKPEMYIEETSIVIPRMLLTCTRYPDVMLDVELDGLESKLMDFPHSLIESAKDEIMVHVDSGFWEPYHA